MSKPIEIDWQTRQQIATWAGIFGAIAALIANSSSQNAQTTNPLVLAFIAFVVSWVMSLVSRAVGVVIIVAASLLILKSCS